MANYGDTVYPTVAQVRSLGTWVQNYGRVSGMNFRDSDYNFGDVYTSGTIGPFTITEQSARDTVADYGHLQDDGSIELRVSALYVTNCVSGFDWMGLTLSHRNNVGIYGPEPAHTHADWTGTGGVTTPNGAGAFSSSSAAGTLTLTLSSGYNQRLSDAPQNDFPAGMDSVPHVYWRKRADVYRALNGQAGRTTGNPYSIPAEGVWCWLGWPVLRFTFTAPSACTLTLTVTYHHEYVYTDNHLTDSTRQTEFESSYSEAVRTYRFAVEAGAGTYDVELVAPTEGAHPEFVNVQTLQLTGFAIGAWTLGQPALRLAGDTAPDMKGFEGYEYRKGGLSAHADAAFLKAMWQGDEDHGNVAEDTLPHFDYLEGAGSGLDLTTAFTLGAQADNIDLCCDAWDCEENTATVEMATEDEDDTSLGSVWGFDIVPADYTALVQAAAAGGCALRGVSWAGAAGITYLVRTDKVIGGKLHGNVIENGALAKSEVGAAQVWRRESADSAWAQWQGARDADAAGHWHSTNLPEVRAYSGGSVSGYWLYAAAHPSSAEPSRGQRAPAREYIARHVLIFIGGVDLLRLAPGFLARASKAASVIVAVKRLTHYGGTWAGNDAAPDVASDATPTLASDRHDTLWCWYHDDSGNAQAVLSPDYAGTWAAWSSLAGVTHPRALTREGDLLLAGYGGTGLECYKSTDAGLTLALAATVDATAPEQCAGLAQDRHGVAHLVWSDAAGNLRHSYSADGVTWSAADAWLAGTKPHLVIGESAAMVAYFVGSALHVARVAGDWASIADVTTPTGTFTAAQVGIAYDAHGILWVAAYDGDGDVVMQWSADEGATWTVEA